MNIFICSSFSLLSLDRDSQGNPPWALSPCRSPYPICNPARWVAQHWPAILTSYVVDTDIAKHMSDVLGVIVLVAPPTRKLKLPPLTIAEDTETLALIGILVGDDFEWWAM